MEQFAENGGKNGKIFDMRITLGSILHIVILIVAIALGYAGLSGRITVLEQEATDRTSQLNGIDVKIDEVNSKITDMAIEQGKQEQKLEDERRVDGK